MSEMSGQGGAPDTGTITKARLVESSGNDVMHYDPNVDPDPTLELEWEYTGVSGNAIQASGANWMILLTGETMGPGEDRNIQVLEPCGNGTIVMADNKVTWSVSRGVKLPWPEHQGALAPPETEITGVYKLLVTLFWDSNSVTMPLMDDVVGFEEMRLVMIERRKSPETGSDDA